MQKGSSPKDRLSAIPWHNTRNVCKFMQKAKAEPKSEVPLLQIFRRERRKPAVLGEPGKNPLSPAYVLTFYETGLSSCSYVNRLDNLHLYLSLSVSAISVFHRQKHSSTEHTHTLRMQEFLPAVML